MLLIFHLQKAIYLVTDASVVGLSLCNSEPNDRSRCDGARSIISVLSLREGDGMAADVDVSVFVVDVVDDDCEVRWRFLNLE